MKVLFLLILTLTLISCAKDKTQEEWQREKQAQQMSHIQDISGTYTGNLDSTQSNGPSQFALEVKPGVSVFANPGTQSTGVLVTAQGRASIINDTSSSASFDSAYFNQDSNELHAEINILDAANIKNTLDIDGIFSNNHFDGTISNRLYPNIRYEIHLTNGAKQVVLNNSSLKSNLTNKNIKSYKGSVNHISDSKPTNSYLLIQKPILTSEQSFLLNFSSTQIVDATFGIIMPDSNHYIPGSFHNCQFNLETKTLLGREVQQSGSDLISRILECKFTDSMNEVNCNYSVSTKGLIYSGQMQATESL